MRLFDFTRRRAFIGCTAIAAALFGCETPVVDLTEPPVAVMSEVPGSGREARKGNIVTIDYEIRLPDGREVLSAQGYQFRLGEGTVIRGIDRAVEGMRIGGRRTVECPPHMHWGRAGYADVIPPNTRLTIDVQLVRVR